VRAHQRPFGAVDGEEVLSSLLVPRCIECIKMHSLAMAAAQRMLKRSADGRLSELRLPSPAAEVVAGVRWGRFDVFFTPAFWVGQAWQGGTQWPRQSFRLGDSLREEVAACLLGGHGIPAEVGSAAFERLRSAGVLSGSPSCQELQDLLTPPLSVRGRPVRYRFARQKARYLAGALAELPPSSELPRHIGRVLRASGLGRDALS